MILDSIVAKVVTSTVFAVSAVSVSFLPADTIKVEEPAPVVVATSSPSVQKSFPKKVQNKRAKGDCLAYKDILDNYEWPVDIALEVCKAESSGNPNNIGDKHTAYVSCGLMQVRALPGRPSCEQLKNPETNIAFAYELWRKEGWRPWSVCRTVVDCS